MAELRQRAKSRYESLYKTLYEEEASLIYQKLIDEDFSEKVAECMVTGKKECRFATYIWGYKKDKLLDARILAELISKKFLGEEVYCHVFKENMGKSDYNLRKKALLYCRVVLE